MNLKFACLSGLLVMSALGLASCSDDDKWPVADRAAPEFNIDSEHLMTVAGRSIKIAGTIKDADGISAINLTCPALQLNKTINIVEIYGEPLKEYELDYEYKIQENVEGESFTVKVEVTDVAGKTSSHDVLVTLDADFTAPVFTAAPDREVTVLIKANTVFNLKFTVEDNREIDYVTVNVDGVQGFPIRVEGEGKNKVEFAQALSLPGTPAEYKMTITAYDVPAQEDEVRSSKVESTLSVSELPDFSVLYLADVETAADLNSDLCGVPMAMDHVAPYKYRVRYYNAAAGTKICFLPQKTDFGPICFGPEADNAEVLGDDPDAVGRITLDKAGVYYLITVNTYDRTFTLEDYPVSEATNPVAGMHYGQNDLNTWNDWTAPDPWWQEWYFGPAKGPGEILSRMEQDKNNPNIFYIDNWKLEEGEQNFILHNWHSNGWWNFTTWRVDNSSDPSKCVYYGNAYPDNDHFTGTRGYFEYKYINVDPEEYKFMYPNAGPFDESKWGDEGYRKNFIGDNWIKPTVTKAGNYRLVFDAHSEHIKILPM